MEWSIKAICYDVAERVSTSCDQTIRNVPANRFDGFCRSGIRQRLRGTLRWTGRRVVAAEFESRYHIRKFVAQILNTTISVWRPALCDSHLRIASRPYHNQITIKNVGQIREAAKGNGSAPGGRIGSACRNRVEQLTVAGGRWSVAGYVARGILCSLHIVFVDHLPHSLYPMYPMYIPNIPNIPCIPCIPCIP